MATSWVVFACVSGGALLGTRLARVLPENYLIESKEVRGLTMGLVATMSALVLALLVSSAKDSFDSQKNGVTQLAASFVLLDRVLTEYGPETSTARAELHNVAVSCIDQLWASHSLQSQRTTRADVNDFLDRIRPLRPRDDLQRALLAQAIQITAKLGETMALLTARSGGSISAPSLVVLVFWLTILFVSFGLSAPSNNSVVVAALLLGAFSVSCAIFLILQLDQPFYGLIQISSASLDNVANMGK